MFYFILISSCKRRLFYFEWIYKDFFLFEGNSFSSGWVGTKDFSFYGEYILTPVAMIFFYSFCIFFYLLIQMFFIYFFHLFCLFLYYFLSIYFSIYLLLLSCPGSVQHHLIRGIIVTSWCWIGWECWNLLKYSILEEERKK